MIYETKKILSEHTHCTKCGGREFLDQDYYGAYVQCLQCGHLRNLNKVIDEPAKTSDKVYASSNGNPYNRSRNSKSEKN